MNVRINPQRELKKLYNKAFERYYDKKTGKLKNETEFFNEVYDTILHINMARDYLNINKYIEFCVLTDEMGEEYYFDDKLTGTPPTTTRDISNLIRMSVNLMVMLISISKRLERNEKE